MQLTLTSPCAAVFVFAILNHNSDDKLKKKTEKENKNHISI